MDNSDDSFRSYFRQAFQKYGRLYFELYQFKASSSQVPLNLSPAIKNAVAKLGNISPGVEAEECVKTIFQVYLSRDEAIYFLEYIGAMSVIKKSRSQLVQIGSFKENLKQSYLDGQLTLMELVAELGLPFDIELLKLSLGTLGPDKIHQELTSRTLIATLENIDRTLLELNKLEKEVRESLISTIGLTAMREEKTLNANAVERLAEEYFINQLSRIHFCLN